MLSTITPSEWGRQIVRGAYDLHVHVAPASIRSSPPTRNSRRGIWAATISWPWPARGHSWKRCFTTPFTGKHEWARMVENIQATGAERTIVTIDLGQPDNPPVEDGLALMADALHTAGFTDQEITMIVSNSRLLAGPAGPGPVAP